MPADQTMVYLIRDGLVDTEPEDADCIRCGTYSTDPREALIFDDLREVEKRVATLNDGKPTSQWVNSFEIPDVDVFLAEDLTW